MNYISEHAKKRFKERYDFDIPEKFVDYCLNNGIKQKAINRKGHVVNNENKGIYRVVFANKIIEYVLCKQKNGDNVIATFNNPPAHMYDVCYSYRGEE